MTIPYFPAIPLPGTDSITEFKKSPFGNHPSNNWSKQDSSVDAKVIRWKFVGEQDIYIISKYFPTDDLSVTKGKMPYLETWWIAA